MTADESFGVEGLFNANAEERRRDSMLARRLADVVASADVDRFLEAVDLMADGCDAWRLAFRRIGAMASVAPAIQEAFLHVWIEHKHLPLRVGHRPTMARALRVLMPGTTASTSMMVFRGTSAEERRRRLYGFSWTTDLTIARNFASAGREHFGGAVVLRTTVPADAVLLIRQPVDYYDEAEVVVDPYKLGGVEAIERLAPTASRSAPAPR